MTDLQKFIALYATLGIDCKVYEWNGLQTILLANAKFNQLGDKTDTGIPKEFWTLSDKVNGYTNFWIEYVFENGVFQTQNILE